MAGHTIQISVLADTKRFSSAMKNLGRTSGLSRLGEAFRKAGSRVVGFFRSGIKWAGAFGAAMLGLALKGGIERSLKIEDAQAKLRGLGHTTESINTIMDSALASVKGTAAGLDEAATMAANAVAAGIEPGENLTAALSLVNDAATIAGVSMGEMGSIFSKVWTSGRAQTQELNQIADRGIPIWTELADHYGVSADELRKMVSAGKVDAATFETVMRDMLGGSALEAGNTTRGAFANMRAALSRFGQSLLSGIFPMFKTAFGGITEWLDRATDAVGPAAERFSQWLGPALRDVGQYISTTVVPVVQDLAARFRTDVVPALTQAFTYVRGTVIPALIDFGRWLADNRHTLGVIASAIAGFVSALHTMNYIKTVIAAVRVAAAAFKAFGASLLANPIGLVVAAIAALVAGLTYFFTQTETGRRIWDSVWSGIQAVAQAVADWFTGTLLPLLQGVWDGIMVAAEIAGKWYQEHIAPIFDEFGKLVSEVWQRIQEHAELLWAGLQFIWDLISAQWEYLWTGVQVVWAAIGPPVIAAIQGAFEHMKIVLQTVWNVIRTVIETVLGVIRGVIRAVTAAIRGDWSGVWNAIKGIAETVWNGIKGVVLSVLNGIVGVIRNGLNTVKSVWDAAWNNVKSILTKAWHSITNGVRDGINRAVSFVRELPKRARAALSNIGNVLLNAGKNLIRGFINGIRDMFGSVRDTLGNLTSRLTSWKGPPQRDKKLLKGAGQLIIKGLIDGLESQYGNVRKSLGGLTGMVADTDLGTLPAPGVRAFLPGGRTPALTGGGRSAGAAPVINVYALADGPEVGRRVHAALRNYQASNGVRLA